MESSPRTEYYHQRISALGQGIAALTRRSKTISRIRLITFLVAIGLTWLLWHQSLLLISVLLLLTGIFLFLVSTSTTVDQELQLQLHLLQINKEEEIIIQGRYQHRKPGESYWSAFEPKINGMARDLDVFGQGSLYQYINRTRSVQGSDQFASSLVRTYSSTDILQRQEAIRELTPMIEWRQRLMALQFDNPITRETYTDLKNWLDNPSFLNISNTWKRIAILLPGLTVIVTLIYLFKIIPTNVYIYYGISVFIVLAYTARLAGHWFKPLHRIRDELETLLPCIQSIESQPFQSSWINGHISGIVNPDRASHRIARLNKIIDRFDYRLNPIVFIPLNFFLCWDLQQVLALNQWRRQFKGNIAHWFESLAELESLSSFAHLAFNHPDWVYPLMSATWFTFESKGLAHPLLSPSKAITNDFYVHDPNRIALITGSNMAGKSTFLRSIGTNIVLAGAGAPVHARYFKLSPGPVLTSMRISDNLQEETSTFYAELKKIKSIVDAVKAKEHVILLIDEMLRGTNAADRKIGSHGLLRQLITHEAVGVIASHDTSLSEFADQYPDILRTYYFDSYLDGDELKFDYTLKQGVCTSANASYLMKKMGIEI